MCERLEEMIHVSMSLAIGCALSRMLFMSPASLALAIFSMEGILLRTSHNLVKSFVCGDMSAFFGSLGSMIVGYGSKMVSLRPELAAEQANETSRSTTSAAVAISSAEPAPTPSCWKDQQHNSRVHTAGFNMFPNT
eukprot:Mycagemm_TRINITY_DN10137_c0_g4::TRINITY_DN10137_c0_g4_i1::g.5317::m.5317 type:complete len:136 gc:universal TRINITY_DN10137_c0_g4_i1:539-132(-)